MKSIHARHAIAVVLGLSALTLPGLHSAPDAVAAAASGWSFGPSGLDGAGFQNVIAASPFKTAVGTRPLLVGADIAGIHRSWDGGATWAPSARGLPDSHVAALLWSRTLPGRVYAATKAGISESTDFGNTWSRLPAPANFDPNGSYQVARGEEHPRATGQLLEQATAGGVTYLWAGTATQGLKRSADDGRTWQRVALVGQHLRSIISDPTNPDVLYVAAAHAGLFVSRNARGDMTFSRVAGSPQTPEELAFVNGSLYGVAGPDGAFRYDGSWHTLNSGLPGKGAAWESIAGFRGATGNTVLYVGCAQVSNGQAVMRSTDGGQSWTSVTSGAAVTVSPLVFGSTSDWWANSIPYLRFAGPSYVASQLLIDPDDSSAMLIAGRGGVWRGRAVGSAMTWWPAMRHLMVTVNMDVVADPKVAGRLFIGSMDFTSFGSRDWGADIIHTMPAGAPSTGDVVTVDPGTAGGQPSAVYLGASRRGGNTGDGGIWSSPDPMAGSGWQSEHLPVSSDVTALGVGHPASGRIILAGVSSHRLWRKSGSTWTQITGTAPFQTGSTGSFAWVRGGSTVYALDSEGVWRSDQGGAAGSWVKLLRATASYRSLDALVVDPTDAGTVYVSADSLGGVWRISGAGTQPAAQRILALRNSGPIAIDSAGNLFAHDSEASRLFRSGDPRVATPAFSVVSDDFYANNNRMIRSLSIGPDGYIYTASNHAGVSVGVPRH